MPESRRRLVASVLALRHGRVCAVLEGPTASGKSALSLALLHASDQPFKVVSFTAETMVEDLFGSFLPGKYGCKFVPGPLLEALQQGLAVVLEDVCVAPEETALSLASIVAASEVFNPLTGKRIKVHPEFWAM